MEIQKNCEEQNITEEWEVLDHYCYELEEEEYGEAEKHKRWKMGNWVMEAGKKLVMTGVVISSVPVVLPPLLVVSALGFAMSLPFGVVFASYACTHKLMTKLLPLPPAPAPVQEMVKRNIVEEEEEMMMMGEDMRKENLLRIELVEDEHDLQVGGKNNDSNARMRPEEKREIDVLQESPDHQESSTSTPTPTPTPTPTASSSENENGNIIFEEEIRPSEELDGEKNKQQGSLMNDDAPTLSSLDKEDNKTAQPSPADHRGEDPSEPKTVVGDSALTGDSDKELESKINAIRVIVGFKAPRRSSYLEEVKALYLFTGIDPPSASELDDNLTFLMSVIGLK